MGTLYYVENDINLLLDPEQMAAILDFLLTMQCRKYFLTTPQCPVYLKTPHESASNMSKMISISCLTLKKWRPSWIFYSQCNVENIFWQCHCVEHTLKSYNGHQKHESVSIVLKNISTYCLILENGGHLGFYPQCNVQNYFRPHH